MLLLLSLRRILPFISAAGFAVAVVWLVDSPTHFDARAQDAQGEAALDSADDKKPADPVAEWAELQKKQKQFEQTVDELRKRFQKADDAEKLEIQQEYAREFREFQTQVLPRLFELADAVYAAQPDNKEAAELALVNAYTKNRYERVCEIGEAELKAGRSGAVVLNLTGIAQFATHNFERAEEVLKKADAEGVLDSQQFGANRFLAECARYRKLWAAEQEIRKAEASSDPKTALPRVQIETDKGKIVVELFENEAPNTVANFVHLAETGFYNGTTFHRVIPAFMVQGGDPNSKDEDPANDGTGGPDYTIACECYQPNARMHFRGSLSMAHAGRDTGGSQFFITHLPTPHLNPNAERNTGHTVFGRVIEGMDVVDAIKRADKIIKMTVLRKRPHEYLPKTTPDADQ